MLALALTLYCGFATKLMFRCCVSMYRGSHRIQYLDTVPGYRALQCRKVWAYSPRSTGLTRWADRCRYSTVQLVQCRGHLESQRLGTATTYHAASLAAAKALITPTRKTSLESSIFYSSWSGKFGIVLLANGEFGISQLYRTGRVRISYAT